MAVEVGRGRWPAGKAMVIGIAVEIAVNGKVRAVGERLGCTLCSGMGPGPGEVPWGARLGEDWRRTVPGGVVAGAWVVRMWLPVAEWFAVLEMAWLTAVVVLGIHAEDQSGALG